MVLGTRMEQRVREHLIKDWNNTPEEERLDVKEEYENNIKMTIDAKEQTKKELAFLEEINSIIYTPEAFKKITPEYEYEKNPRYWELQLERALQNSANSVREVKAKIAEDEQMLSIMKEVLAKIELTL